MSKVNIEDFNNYMVPCFSPANFIPVRGLGSRIWDQDNKEYLDLSGGIAVNVLGHANINLINNLIKQINKLWHISNNYTNEPILRLAKKLVNLTFADKVFFCNSGAEANEAALKLSRKYAHKNYSKNKNEIISFKKSFHGRTLFTVAVGGQSRYSEDFAPLPQEITHLPYNNLSTFIKHISFNTCAVIVEPILGEGGVIPAEKRFLHEIRNLCNKYNATLIFDEIQTGIGRTGYLYSYQDYEVVPDILTSAKGLGGGFPIGAMLVKDKWAQVFQPGSHGTTFGGNPLAAVVADSVISQLTDFFLKGVIEKNHFIINKLNTINKKYKIFQEIRGKGLLIGAELKLNYFGKSKLLSDLAAQEGVLILIAGSNVIRLAPALNISFEELDIAFYRLENAILNFKNSYFN